MLEYLLYRVMFGAMKISSTMAETTQDSCGAITPNQGIVTSLLMMMASTTENPSSMSLLPLMIILVPLMAYGLVAAILHLKFFFGRALRALIATVDPLVPTDKEIKKIISTPISLKDVEDYIKEDQEKQPVIEGCEKCITWADPSTKQKTPFCVVFLHGWSASRQEGRPVVGRMAQHLRANLFSGRLPGHGRKRPANDTKNPASREAHITPPDGEALANETKPRDMFLTALDALRVGLALGDKVILVGISTGGVLTTWLSALLSSDDLFQDGSSSGPKLDPSLRERIVSMILISPAYALSHPLYPVLKHGFAALRVLPLIRDFARKTLIQAVTGTHRDIPHDNDDHYRFCTLHYPSTAVLNLVDILYEMEIIPFPDITMPILMIGNPQDPVANFRVKATNTFLKFGDAPNKVLYCITRGENQHIMSCDYKSPSTVDEVTDMIKLFLYCNGIVSGNTALKGENEGANGNHHHKGYMMERELERTNSDPKQRDSLGGFASYPGYNDVTKPMQF